MSEKKKLDERVVELEADFERRTEERKELE